MSDGIVVRKCHGMEEFQRCVDLQKEIWGEADIEVEPATLFVVAAVSFYVEQVVDDLQQHLCR